MFLTLRKTNGSNADQTNQKKYLTYNQSTILTLYPNRPIEQTRKLTHNPLINKCFNYSITQKVYSQDNRSTNQHI